MLLFFLRPQVEKEEDGGWVQVVPSPSTGVGWEVVMTLCRSGERSLVPREPFL